MLVMPQYNTIRFMWWYNYAKVCFTHVENIMIWFCYFANKICLSYGKVWYLRVYKYFCNSKKYITHKNVLTLMAGTYIPQQMLCAWLNNSPMLSAYCTQYHCVTPAEHIADGSLTSNRVTGWLIEYLCKLIIWVWIWFGAIEIMM